jgi:D-alanyl-lipoteichoic acid acyltransferase DltB (MBOAT superfamily)
LWSETFLFSLLILFFVLVGIQPTKGKISFLFFLLSTIVGVVFIAFNYYNVLSYGVIVKIYPFLLKESYRGRSVVALDWSQIVGLVILLNGFFQWKLYKKPGAKIILVQSSHNETSFPESEKKEE